MKKSILCAAALLVAGTFCCNMAMQTAPVMSMSSSILVSAEETVGNLIVNISGLTDLSGVIITVTGNGNTYTEVTNSNGQAIFSKLPVNDSTGKEITYTIKESIPDGYLAASAMTTTISAGATVIASIPNTEKTYTIAIDCKDYKTDSITPSGDAVLNGGSYTVYHDGVAYGTYSIGADGKLCEFTLHGKEYEGKWEVQMDTAPVGYYLTGEKQELGYYDGDTWIPLNSSFPQYTHATMHLSLLPISGRISVTANSGDQLQIYLRSSGSFDNCRSSERAQITIGTDGKSVTTDSLPFGTYVVNDLTTGESTTVKITEFGSVTSVDLTNTVTTAINVPNQYISVYQLYDQFKTTLISSGTYVDGEPLKMAAGMTAGEVYMLRVEQGCLDSDIGTALDIRYIVLHEDGTYEEYKENSGIICGDTNLDGKVDITDAVLLNKAASGAVQLNEQAVKNADCNDDGVLSVDDSVALLRFLVHLITSLPE